ncbi:MAG TPA: heparan-alpha-glucosaminide N-acetyltransferase domain-containing protein [Kofleriaceae bacterium]|nr:heparan-alpha-glucosaminide N-acetyltransferase domain-containing protein [Kofleriaceae bacterium]
MRRVVALDWMRGIVMVLMAIDHASGAFNGGRLFTDAVFLYEPGSPLPAAQFFTRWVTHLCAPAFLFLAGTSLAISVERRRKAGLAVDGHIAVRALILLALEVVWMSWAWQMRWHAAFLQVLFAIGASLLVMIPLRRLPAVWLLAGGIVLTVASEWVVVRFDDVSWIAVLFSGGPIHASVEIWYPVVPWLAIMMIGWAFGRHLADGGRPELPLWIGGAASLAVFALVRGVDGYGNLLLHRDDGSLIQWLHVAKYPPSLAFTALELGIMALALAGLFRLEGRIARPPTWSLVLGQTALFFYLLHAHLLEGAAKALGMSESGGLVETYLAAAAVLALLFPLCWWYRNYKQAHPRSLARFI